MVNNFENLKNSIRSIAKRCKTISYSTALVVSFAMLGTNAFSQENILTGKEIHDKATNLEESLKTIKDKNSKKLKGAKLELIQLMEQGDQVVKSPWSSWQFGLNYVQDNYKGAYKGRGDKNKKYPYEGIFARSNDKIIRSIAVESSQYSKLKFNTMFGSALSSNRKGLDLNYGIAVDEKAIEPIVGFEVNVAVKPRVFNDNKITVDLPKIEVTKGNIPDMQLEVRKSLEPPVIKEIKIPLELPEPNTKPFTGFSFWDMTIDPPGKDKGPNGELEGAEDHTHVKYYIYDSQGGINKKAIETYDGILGTDPWDKTSISNIDPKTGKKIKDVEVHKVNDQEGMEAIHHVWNARFDDLHITLYDKTAAFALEAWQVPKFAFKDTTVDIKGDDATVFYFFPVDGIGIYYEIFPYRQENGRWSYHAPYQRGAFIGGLDVDVKYRHDTIFSTVGIVGSYNISPEGTFKMEGSENLIFSYLGYAPNLQKIIDVGKEKGAYIARVRDQYGTGMTPIINLKSSPEIYGDGNVGYFFSDLLPDGTKEYPKTTVFIRDGWKMVSWYINDGKTGYKIPDEYKFTYDRAKWDKLWKQTKIGIYQGEINAKAIVGNKLALDTATGELAEEQTDIGNTIITTNEAGDKVEVKGNNKYVENVAVLLGQSGQRGEVKVKATDGTEKTVKITPSRDLGQELTPWADLDEIHGLYVNDINMVFGKYSLKNLGLVADRGTEIDVAVTGVNTSTPKEKGGVALRTETITDYGEATKVKSSYNDAVNEAATGTIFAYAKGNWGDSTTRTTPGDGYTPMSEETVNAFRDQKSVIYFGLDVNTSARYKKIGDIEYYPVTYAAEGGIINAKNTKAFGYGSIISYAKAGGEINIDGTVTAKDEWAENDIDTKPYLKKNIGAYATGENSKIVISGKSEIYGSGAHALEKGKVELNGADNEITVGDKVVGLFAKNGGEIKFGGGTITVGDGASRDSIPFYAIQDESSPIPKIKFDKDTNVVMTNGFIPIEDSLSSVEDATNYAADSKDSAKYEGMGKVTLNLSKDAELTKIRDGEDITWNGIYDLPAKLKTDMKVKDLILEDPEKNISLYYINGKIAIDTDVDLSDKLDGFNSVKMERDVVTINPGKRIYSTTGKGLTVSSNKGASQSDNNQTGYINEGTVDITGGTTDKTAALAVNYGIVKNNKEIKVDTGTGIFGTNGSKIENSATGSIEISGKGYGIVSSVKANEQFDFGLDASSTVKPIDIINAGNIKISGNDSIGIYADNNSGRPRSDVTVLNSGKIEIKDTSIGIAVRGRNGGVITVNVGGNSDITAGIGSIGIQGENSKVVFNNDYTIETKQKGVGIYLTGNSIAESTNSNNIFKYRYSGAVDAQGTAISYNMAAETNGTNNVNITLDNAGHGKLIGIYVDGAGTFTNTGNITGTSTANEIGIAGENVSIINSGNITLGDATTITKPNIGIFANGCTVSNRSSIQVGNNSVGIYGKGNITSTGIIKAGEKGIGIYSLDGNVAVSGSVEVGQNGASGIYALGQNKRIEINDMPTMVIGKESFGVVNKGSGNSVKTNVTDVKLATDSVFIFSTDHTGTIENSANISNIGSSGGNYGIYSVGNSSNSGTIDLRNGIGNIGMFTINGAKAVNTGKLIVGETNVHDSLFSIGMAAGVNGENGGHPTTGIIENKGRIEVKGKHSVGMFATQSGSTATNTGTIVLDADHTIGIYAEEDAKVINKGTITTGSGNYKHVTGVYLHKGAVLENEGTINIDSKGGQGVYLQGGTLKNYGTITVGGTAKKTHNGTGATSKTVGPVTIEAPAEAIQAVIKLQTPEGIVIEEPEIVIAKGVKPGTVSANSIGIYVDTSGIRFTNPIENLAELTEEADLLVGTEAVMDTNSKAIVVEDSRILEPYNQSILNNIDVSKWNVYSAGLTWMATATLDKNNGTIKKLYMRKIPYTEFSGDKNTYNFLDGLEQRYGMNSLGSKEKELFNKINGIGKNEEILFNQAVDEMMGHQYANVEQRIYDTGRILDKEFKYLKDEWRTMSKDSNKVKVFGMNGEYSTDTAGIIDYKSDAYGVAYLGENETLKLGDTSGWYAGLVENRFKFKDIGKSKEKQLQGKFGVFKSVPFDYNNSLNWTISGEGFVGYNKMDRKYLVVDKIFGAKSDYWSYGVALRNELSKNFRMTESTNFKLYGAVKAEYGRYSDIKEKSGEVKLEIKGNDYLSVRPEIGGELGYKHILNDKYYLSTKLNVAYEDELGELNDRHNKARVRETTADWYKLRSEKEDRRGNVRTDLSIGIDNERYGVTANIGYDTKGKNRRIGLGLRVIF
ncbi:MULTISPECIES: autotransporter-associated N-terminal domain-containing protein [unclassified Fusobacterium]|uniref:autotransporter-associated N-terminal domain-containing protein n=2 Tax=unclassified Fusobacterium TaxID=2648384 RepID=UPI001B8AC8B3|nr:MULTISPECIES: autotransporter-associated N-terminal domain-containing protein [unclassified Fusobacterium]MBR8700903.1 hypothetical protein [Fusobacterium sp. DD45]MBR8710683.1 hypothetical protein [Fusobacterium sp. DD28]MBR8751269.1 hypothetical protein [Fusobacterium sp. DD26]